MYSWQIDVEISAQFVKCTENNSQKFEKVRSSVWEMQYNQLPLHSYLKWRGCGGLDDEKLKKKGNALRIPAIFAWMHFPGSIHYPIPSSSVQLEASEATIYLKSLTLRPNVSVPNPQQSSRCK